MNRQEAIRILKGNTLFNSREKKEALKMAISSLETDEAYQLEYEQPEFCADCISRKDVIELIEGWWLGHTKEDDLSTEIQKIPSVYPKSDTEDITFKDDNAVSRLSVRDIIYANAYELEYPDSSSEYVVNRDEIIKYLMELPRVYPKSESEKPSGKWIENEAQPHVEKVYHCSNCGNKAWGEYEKTTYCSHCGAHMVEEQESE